MDGHSRNCTWTCKCICIYVCPAHRHTDTEPSKNILVLCSFPQDSGALSGSANDQRKPGTCCCRPALKHSMGRIKRLIGGIVMQVLTRFLFNFVFAKGFFHVSVLPLPLFLSPRPVCRSQHAHVCAFKTFLCVQSKRPRALNVRTSCWSTR